MLNISFIEDSEKLNRIRHSLPSKSITWTPSAILIKHSDKDQYFVLKSRYRDTELLNLPEDSFEYFNERRSWDSDNSDLERKHLIFDSKMLDERGREALNSL
ncbi:hypothetical protein [Paenibacillus polymyxa]|uniref:hypothetical protein n=1 Tax=Paenibacillus polymyxa TaxID=1406 RepID=UPI00287FC666|nr:hypothetical protein [Paenibacillus polymyxa]